MKESEIRNSEVLDKYLTIVAADIKRIFHIEAFETTPCPACGRDETTKQFDKNGFTYVTCDYCGTLFVNPRPTKQQLDAFYSQSDANQFWVENFFLPYEQARREKIFVPRAREITKEFPEYSCGTIGDIGAGFGILLEELKKVWNDASLFAIEPSIDMGGICRQKGIHVLPYMFEDLHEKAAGMKKFDLLCAFEVFEHLNNPHIFLTRTNQMLNDGGHLLMTTLNGQGFDIQLLWEKHNNVSPPHHLNFINPKSIRILLEQCGFEVLSLTTPGKLDWDIVEQRIQKEHLDLGRWWNLVCGMTTKAKAEFQQWIARNALSSHIRIVAKKIYTVF